MLSKAIAVNVDSISARVNHAPKKRINFQFRLQLFFLI